MIILCYIANVQYFNPHTANHYNYMANHNLTQTLPLTLKPTQHSHTNRLCSHKSLSLSLFHKCGVELRDRRLWSWAVRAASSVTHPAEQLHVSRAFRWFTFSTFLCLSYHFLLMCYRKSERTMRLLRFPTLMCTGFNLLSMPISQSDFLHVSVQRLCILPVLLGLCLLYAMFTHYNSNFRQI